MKMRPECRREIRGQQSGEPIERLGRPEEIGAAVVWLCSDAAAFVIGHAMVVDNGQTV